MLFKKIIANILFYGSVVLFLCITIVGLPFIIMLFIVDKIVVWKQGIDAQEKEDEYFDNLWGKGKY